MSKEAPHKTPSLNLKQPYVWLATWLGFGLLRPAPGTWGSLGAIPFGIILYASTGPLVFILGIILITAIGYWAAARFEQETGIHDCKMVVIDEVAGQWIALLPALYATGINPLSVFLAFILFRFFDIIKPWPISHFDENVEGALGVMADDIIAGLAAALCMTGLIYAGLG